MKKIIKILIKFFTKREYFIGCDESNNRDMTSVLEGYKKNNKIYITRAYFK